MAPPNQKEPLRGTVGANPKGQDEILDAAVERAKTMLQFVAGGPVAGEQEGDDPLTCELILANGWG